MFLKTKRPDCKVRPYIDQNNLYFIETGTFKFSHSSAKPFLVTTIFILSLKVEDFSGFAITRKTSFAGSSVVVPASSFIPHLYRLVLV